MLTLNIILFKNMFLFILPLTSNSTNEHVLNGTIKHKLIDRKFLTHPSTNPKLNCHTN